jgi:hypothetical protein
MDPESISLLLILNELKSIVKKVTKISVVLFLLFCFMVTSVSAYVYQQSTLTETQNNMEIAPITLKNSDLGNINEGETKVYASSEIPSLGEAISITTTTAPVYLHFNSNIELLSSSYSTYNIDVLYNQVPPLGTGSGIACSMSIASPDPSVVTLDAVGTWVFDLSLKTTAKSIDLNTPATVQIFITTESTNWN